MARTRQVDEGVVRASRVLQDAYAEANQMKDDYVSTEHILLGLIREGEGVAAAVLQHLNVDVGLLAAFRGLDDDARHVLRLDVAQRQA